MSDKPTADTEQPERPFYPDPGKAGETATDTTPTKQPPPAGEDPTKPDPTRFGDWEIKGRCIDF